MLTALIQKPTRKMMGKRLMFRAKESPSFQLFAAFSSVSLSRQASIISRVRSSAPSALTVRMLVAASEVACPALA